MHGGNTSLLTMILMAQHLVHGFYEARFNFIIFFSLLYFEYISFNKGKKFFWTFKRSIIQAWRQNSVVRLEG